MRNMMLRMVPADMKQKDSGEAPTLSPESGAAGCHFASLDRALCTCVQAAGTTITHEEPEQFGYIVAAAFPSGKRNGFPIQSYCTAWLADCQVHYV